MANAATIGRASETTGEAALSSLLKLAEDSCGARFRLADLQLHTPVDRNFRPGTHLDTEPQRDAFAKRYIERVVEAGLGIIGITEHNDVSWIDRLREARGDADLVIFPGFEVSGSEGVHILCLWEPETESSRLDEMLVEMHLPSDRRWHEDGTPRMSDLPLTDLVKFVQDRGGLCILSHVDRQDGVLHRLTGEPRIRAWLESGALAVQCARNPRGMDESFTRRVLLNEADQYRRGRPYACIQTSDARTLEEIGAKPTHIKMSSESIEGLKQAFLDPRSRVRFPDEHELRAYPKILAARWDGCFLEAGIPLNPNLNCLIGGKGTAKSTIIETIRHVFELPIQSDAVGEQAEALLKETFPTSAKLSLLVEVPEPQPTRYVFERTGRDRALVRAADTGEIVDGLQPSSLFRPIVFGQKEIYETAMRVESQLSLLDRYCSAELRPLETREAELLSDVAAKSEELRRLQSDIAGTADRVAELPVLRERKRLFDQAGLAEKLAEQRQLERERTALQGILTKLGEYERLVADFRGKAGDMPVLSELGETPNADVIEDAKKALLKIPDSVKRATQGLENTIAQARRDIESLQSTWQSRFDERRSAFDAAVKEVAGDHGEQEIRDYLQLDARIDELTALEQQLTSRRGTHEEGVRERREWLAALREVRRQIYLVREKKASELTSLLRPTVRVAVEHQGNRRQILSALRALRSGAGQRQLEQMVDRPDFSPSRLAGLLRAGQADLVEEYAVSEGVAQQLLRSASDSQIDELEVIPLEDRVEISLNVGTNDRPELRPLDRLSAGGRSTAILLLALLESEGPLILDQPEDDLDNRFIYDDVVQRLRSAKEERQFLIATHNANIPVLGDAEQIIVLDVGVEDDRVRATVSARGSIDDDQLHGPLEDVLEGGREAFDLRKDKYGF